MAELATGIYRSVELRDYDILENLAKITVDSSIPQTEGEVLDGLNEGE